MDADHSDREFNLKQKELDLQRLADELHMKNKDLKQKEFDIMNADSSDISSNQMADLAER